MSRIVRELLCLGFCLPLMSVGCSSDSPPGALGPAAVAISTSREISADTDRQAVTNGAAAVSVSGDGDVGAKPTPESSLLKLLGELRLNHPDAVWDALPDSYQRDLNGLARLFGERLHPQAWRWFSQIARKGTAVVGEIELEETSHNAALRLMEWLASGAPGDLDVLRRADLGQLLRTRGRLVMADLRVLLAAALDSPEASPALRDVAGPLPQVFDDPSLLKITAKNAEPDRCVLVFQLPVDEPVLAELYRFETIFIRVEGKWVPQALSENWKGLIAAAREWIVQVLPEPVAEDNFGIVFRYLAQLDSMIEVELAAVRGEQTIEPTLFDIVEYALGLAEDLGFPVPAVLWGGEGNEPMGDATGDTAGEAGAMPATEPDIDADRPPAGEPDPADAPGDVDAHSARTSVLAPRIQACC